MCVKCVEVFEYWFSILHWLILRVCVFGGNVRCKIGFQNSEFAYFLNNLSIASFWVHFFQTSSRADLLIQFGLFFNKPTSGFTIRVRYSCELSLEINCASIYGWLQLSVPCIHSVYSSYICMENIWLSEPTCNMKMVSKHHSTFLCAFTANCMTVLLPFLLSPEHRQC